MGYADAMKKQFIEATIASHGVKYILSSIIQYLGNTDYELQLKSDLEIALKNYENRYEKK